MMNDCRILTIQSHVVYGYVGNKSATFPLQLLGFETDVINSVQFSNHTEGYTTFLGQMLESSDLLQLYNGLNINGIDNYSHLLTGYTRSKSFLLMLVDVCKKLKKKNPNLIYVCDPVLGDDGRLYVSDELVSVYRDDVITQADIITPNQFEAELLTGMKITSLKSAKEVMLKLHEKGPEVVVISSTSLEFSRGILVALASTIEDGEFKCLKIEIPYLNANYRGSGDLFSALLLAWWQRTNFDLKTTLEIVASTMYVVLKNTLDHYFKYDAFLRRPHSSEIELKIVQSKKDIEEPKIILKAEYF
ncbi:hypothetical protein HELRODRAFT_116539 [Helobdella robusta]|uniref:Pyridoxal kinase n=1 Tax=Helobdella robusta TaxID=6412 RepID=T1EGF8_HELRO|nr:hypothetical protein HELRODRAFT_116539 [Helobdella robusta]ESN90152.1 hypothetical protein HELRODRAFT_116539 [Helobdella robusta]